MFAGRLLDRVNTL